MGHGNSVPRFHVTWGTGPGIVEPFERRAREAARAAGSSSSSAIASMRCRSPTARSTASAARSSSLTIVERGQSSSRKVVGDFALRAQAVIVASGGIGGNHDLVRQNWPKRLGAAAEVHDLRRARACRRPHDRHHRGRRRAADQPRPHVALRRRHPELVADLAAPRHPHPARPVLDVVRRHGQAPARAAVPRLRHARPARLHHVAPATIIPGSS